MIDTRAPIPPGGFTSNADEARWLEKTVVLRTCQLLDSAGVSTPVEVVGLYDLLLLALDHASLRGYAHGLRDGRSEAATAAGE